MSKPEFIDSEEVSNITDFVAKFADFANAVASLVVGHRKILVEGGFDVNLSDAMAAELHAQLLGLTPHWQIEQSMFVEDEDEEEDDDE